MDIHDVDPLVCLDIHDAEVLTCLEIRDVEPSAIDILNLTSLNASVKGLVITCHYTLTWD